MYKSIKIQKSQYLVEILLLIYAHFPHTSSILVLRVFAYIMLGLVKLCSTSLQMKSNELPYDLVIDLLVSEL
jgi:hypothetical protein